MLLGERLPHRPRVPRGTRQRRGLKAEPHGYRLSVEDPLGPAGFAAFGSRPTRVSPDAPACELSQQSGSLIEVNAPTRRRHHGSLSGIRGGARGTQVAQPEDTSAPCGQERRGVHSTHRRQGSPAGFLGELDLSVAWVAACPWISPEALARELSSNRGPGRGERCYPSMSLTELRLRSRLRHSAALSMRPARCRNGAV